MNKMNFLGVFFLVLLSLGAVVVMADVDGLGSGDLVGFVNGAFSGVLSVGSLSVSGSTSLGSVSGDDGVFSGDVNATNINADTVNGVYYVNTISELSSALDNCPDCTIYVNNNGVNYDLSSLSGSVAFNLTSNTSIYGVGYPVFSRSDGIYAFNIPDNNVQNILLSGIIFKGENSNNRIINLRKNITNLYLSDLYFYDFPDEAPLYIGYDTGGYLSNNVYLDRISIFNAKSGIQLQGNNNYVSNIFCNSTNTMLSEGECIDWNAGNYGNFNNLHCEGFSEECLDTPDNNNFLSVNGMYCSQRTDGLTTRCLSTQGKFANINNINCVLGGEADDICIMTDNTVLKDGYSTYSNIVVDGSGSGTAIYSRGDYENYNNVVGFNLSIGFNVFGNHSTYSGINFESVTNEFNDSGTDNGYRVIDELILSGIINPDGIDINIGSDSVNITRNYHKIDTEASAGTDDLDCISGGLYEGQTVLLSTVTDSRDVVFKHVNCANNSERLILRNGTDYTMSSSSDVVECVWIGTNKGWVCDPMRLG